MARLGDHPHVLPIFDLGEEEGQPYMVQPFMAGGDVEGLLATADDHRLTVEQALDLATQICRGLQHAHSPGIVHRDLKPGNVYLADGVVKIGDFGLAVVMDRSRLTQEGMMVGTVSYMPPEQAMGSDVTERADLYALGAMLYEMVAGRPPFLGDDSVSIIGQHINTPPVAPTWHTPECPRPLEALILRLLAKDPAERPESAADVLTALEGIDLAVFAEEPSRVSDEANVLDSLAGGVFVGRQREMGELKAALEDTLSGRGRMVTLVGEPGIGKTRTATELATYAGLRGAQVLWGRCYEDVGAPPYWPWVQVIRSYVRESEPEQLRSEMGAGAADIAEIVSDVRERLPDLRPSPELDDPEQTRFRLFDSVAAFLKGASRTQPLVLMLDDLHWADKPSLLLLEFVARELAGARLLLVGTYRDVELNRRHPLAQSLGELTRERLFQRVLLRGLSSEDVARFIQATSGISPPEGLVAAVHTQTEGNPLFVTEVVRLLVQEGQLSAHPELVEGRGPGSDSWTVRIPEGVREVIGRRLDRLSERCNETLTVASVVGREFGLDLLDRLIEDPSADSGQRMSEDRVLDVLEEALSARVVEELPTGVGRYQFTHALIQETLLGELSITRRVRVHARIAEALEELYGAEAESRAAELAHHFAQAEAVLGTEKMIRYSVAAGERALDALAYEEAQEHFQRAVTAKEGQPADAETAGALFGLGVARAATIERSRAQEAWDLIERAFDYYAEMGNTERAVSVAQQALGINAYITGRAEVMSRALALVSPDSIDEGRLQAQYGYSLFFETWDYEGCQRAFDQAIAIAQREGDVVLEARTLAYAGVADFFAIDYQGALEKFEKAIELSRRTDDLQAEVRARLFATPSLIAMGDSSRARLHVEAALEVAERLRERQWLVLAPLYLGVLSSLEGDWRVAHGFFDRAMEGGTDLASSPSEDYLTVLAGQRQWIATTNFAGCPGRPPDSFANSAVLTTSAKVPDALGWPIDPCFPVQIDPKAEQFEQVVACADQRPFAVHLLQSPQQELPESPALLDLAEYRLHSLHPQSVALPTPPGL